MKHRSTFLFVATAFLISGCTDKTPESNQETSPVVLEAPQKAVKTLSASERLGQKLKNGMAYTDLRKIVLADGWLPLATPECKENVGGEAKICSQQPEVEACSGDGHCNMLFANSDGYSKLKVGSHDDLVKFFEFSSVPSNDTTIACPSQDFSVFLKRFASEKAVQDAFTAPFIKVEELVDDEEKGYDYRSVYYHKSNYSDFNLEAQKDGFHVLDGDKKADSVASEIDIKPDGKDQYFIKYQYGMSEGNSYKFKKLKDCWYLTEDPEAPSP